MAGDTSVFSVRATPTLPFPCGFQVCSQEIKIERDVAAVLRSVHTGTHRPKLALSWGFTLYHKDDLPAGLLARYPKSYTGFRKVCLLCAPPIASSPALTHVPALQPPALIPEWGYQRPVTCLGLCQVVEEQCRMREPTGMEEEAPPMRMRPAVKSIEAGDIPSLEALGLTVCARACQHQVGVGTCVCGQMPGTPAWDAGP